MHLVGYLKRNIYGILAVHLVATAYAPPHF